MGLDLSLEGLVFSQEPQFIFQVPRRDWLSQLPDSLLNPVLGLVGVGVMNLIMPVLLQSPGMSHALILSCAQGVDCCPPGLGEVKLDRCHPVL